MSFVNDQGIVQLVVSSLWESLGIRDLWKIETASSNLARLTMKENIYRADGRMICEACDKEYRRHTVVYQSWALAAEDQCMLHRICNGDLIKT